MNVKKRGICISIILLISIFGITMVSALNTEEWHSANKVSVSAWYSMTLGRTIETLDDIVGLKLDATKFSESDANFAVAGGHKASEIWVSTKNGEMTLLQEINSGEKGLCPRANISAELTYSGPTDKTKAYHYATEVEVTIDGVTTSLQSAIDGGVFCSSYHWVISDWTGGPGCGTVTQTRTFYCARSDGLTMDNSYCTGERECDPSSWICITSSPQTTQTYFHQCYLHLTNPDGYYPYCCPAFVKQWGSLGSWMTCSSYGSTDADYNSNCFITWGQCWYRVWTCY